MYLPNRSITTREFSSSLEERYHVKARLSNSIKNDIRCHTMYDNAVPGLS